MNKTKGSLVLLEAGPALPLGELGNCLRPPSPKILEKNRVVEEKKKKLVSNELQK